jgi:hypothetical protein
MENKNFYEKYTLAELLKIKEGLIHYICMTHTFNETDSIRQDLILVDRAISEKKNDQVQF